MFICTNTNCGWPQKCTMFSCNQKSKFWRKENKAVAQALGTYIIDMKISNDLSWNG